MMDRELAGELRHRSGLIADLRTYVGVVRLYWWLVSLVTVLSVGVALWLQRGALPMYSAEVLMQQRLDAPVMGDRRGAVPMDFGGQLELIRRRAVMREVVERLQLRFDLVSHPDMYSDLVRSVRIEADAPAGSYSLEAGENGFRLLRAGDGEAVARADTAGRVEGPGFVLAVVGLEQLAEPLAFRIRPEQVAVETLRTRLLVEQARGFNQLRLGYSDPDPQRAASIVNTVAETYERQRGAAARAEARRRREAIRPQLDEVEQSLRRAQAAAGEYQARAQLVDAGMEGNTLLQAVLSAESDLRDLRFQEVLLDRLVASFGSDVPDEEALRRVMAMGRDLVPQGGQLDQRLQDLNAERQRLTASRYGVTTSSPQVAVVDSQIVSTREQMRIAAEQALELLQARIGGAEERVASLRAQIGELPARTAELVRLQQEVDATQQVFDRLVDRHYEAQIQEEVAIGDMMVADPAPVPLSPDPGRGLIELTVALLAGLLIGTVGAVVLGQLDSSIRRPAEAERASGLKVLGSIPSIRSVGTTSKAALISKEAFRGLRTNLQFALSQPPRLLTVSSATPGEGKSTVTVNLALALIEHGAHVLIVDADLRRSQVHEILRMPQGPGLAEVLVDRITLQEAIRPWPANPALHVLTAGRATISHAELVGSPRFSELLRQLRAHYDTVLVDSPPVLAVTSTSLIAAQTEGTVMVVRANQTEQEALENAVEQLRRVGAPLAGVVLNDVPLASVSYASYYDAYYSPEDERNGKKDDAMLTPLRSGQK